MKRRDAIQTAGPLNFGAHASHEEYLMGCLQGIETRLGTEGLDDPMAFLDEYQKQLFQKDMEEDENTWLDKFFARDATDNLHEAVLAVSVLFAGAQHQWKTNQGHQHWLDFLRDISHGPVLLERFEAQLKRAFLERMNEQMTIPRDETGPSEKTANETQFQYLQKVKAPDLGNPTCETIGYIFCTGARLSRLFSLHGQLRGR